MKVTAEAYKSYADNPAVWSATSEQAKAVAHLTGSKVEDVPELLRSNVWPTLGQEVSADLLGGGTVKAIADTSGFLKEQGKVPAVLPDYAPYVNKSFAQRALDKQAAN